MDTAALHFTGERIAMTANQRKMLVWILLSALAASLSYAAFRGYFSAELLLGFANSFSC